jgi:hypothetical protein
MTQNLPNRRLRGDSLRGLDFSSWQALLSTVVGLSVITLIAVGIRLLVMQTIQQRRERENRQVNERLKTLIAAYKVLGGSFTGDLSVDPSHRRDMGKAGDPIRTPSSDRARRIRDAVESALADVILLGTEEQVRLAAHAAQELAAGRHVHTADLVISLRNFIRQVLDLDAVPAALIIPKQGPTRSAASKGGKEDGSRDENKRGGKNLDAGGAGSGQGYSAEDPSESHHEP